MKATTSGVFDLVVTSAIQTRHPEAALNSPSKRIPLARKGHLDELQRWAAAGVKVLVIHDIPASAHWLGSVPDCVATHPDDVGRCSGSRQSWTHADPLFEAAASMASRDVSAVDLTDKFCDAAKCYGVIGRVIAYYDGHHMTRTFVRTLAPYLSGPLAAAIRQASGGT